MVYQLDPTFVGLRQMEITTSVLSEREALGAAPASIVVGVDYPDPFTRFRDYDPPKVFDPAYGGGGADRFYRVLRDEIVPHVDATLRTQGGARFLVGHSMGGRFALYATFRHAPPAPPLFAGVIAADPSYSEDLLTYERWHAARSTSLPLRLYRAVAVDNGPAHAIAHGFLNDRLASRNYEGLISAEEVFQTDHGGVIRPAYESGLRFILGGVK